MKLRWILASVFVLGAAYFALFGGDYGYFDLRRFEKERAREQARLHALRLELDSLRALTDSLEQDSATLERIAREKYGLIRDGEKLYRFVDSVPRDTVRRDTITRE